MSTTDDKKNSDLRKILVTVVLLIIAATVALFTIGCTPVEPTSDPKASQATAPEPEPAVDPLPDEIDNGIHSFGDTVTWDDNVSLSVSTPSAYSPTEMAAGMVEGQSTVVFEFVITNNSAENFDPVFVYTTASSGGVEASSVIDISNGVELPPSTVVLPGQTIKWKSAYSVADPSNITMETTIGFEYDAAVFTNG